MAAPKLTSAASILKYIKGRKSFDRVLDKVYFLAAGNGKCTAKLKIEEHHLNPSGCMHTGFISTLVDCISGYSLMTIIPGNYLTTHMHVHHIKKILKDETILIDACVNKIENNIGFMTVRIKNAESEEIVVTGTQTAFVLLQKKF